MTSMRRRTVPKRSATRPEGPAQDAQIYQDMLAQAGSAGDMDRDDLSRPLKKRRVGGRLVGEAAREGLGSAAASPSPDAQEDEQEGQARPSQVIYNDSDNSQDSDADWEDVNLKFANEEGPLKEVGGDLSIELGGEDGHNNSVARRKRVGPVLEQKSRIDTHKLHLLSLIAHVHLRNHWCNTPEAQIALKPLLSKQSRSSLEDQEDQSQFQRSHQLQAGLTQISQDFRSAFRVVGRGLSRCYWTSESNDLSMPQGSGKSTELPLEKADFCKAAVARQTDRDTAAQLFCALLRHAGLETRLVCSLQVLPLAPAVRNDSSVSVPRNPLDFPSRGAREDDPDGGAEKSNDESEEADTPIRRSGLTARGSRPVASGGSTPAEPSPRPSKAATGSIRHSAYPIYWVEVLDAAYQKWIPVDPLVTKTVAKPTKLEPPASDLGNGLSYVLAFEDDGSAVDVTKRYAKAYNAKTRRTRVESTKGGDKWWRRVMRMYRRSYRLDRDQVEESQLLAKEAAEPMPKNVADFKDHPYFVLERHLRRNEVIEPRREAGRVAVGNKAVEPIFRRQDVHQVKSADGWYRLGSEVKRGELPLKWTQPRKRKDGLFDDDDGDDAGTAPVGKPMFAPFQTCPYEPPPVENGKVPRNVYGNIDVYVPSMVPAGGAHVAHPDAARAARLLGVDYADAVTGFEFRGRTGTAVVKGAVVTVEAEEAVRAVVQGFEDEREAALLDQRADEALRMWKRLLTGLRIRERIEGYEIEGERPIGGQKQDKSDGGNFVEREVFVDGSGQTFDSITPKNEAMDDDEFMDTDDEDGGGFLPEDINLE